MLYKIDKRYINLCTCIDEF